MTSASLQFGNFTAGNGNYIFQGIQNAPFISALGRKQFRHGNPPPLNRNFLGRNDEITAIKAAFQEAGAGKQKRYVIYGMAGIGKSEICVKLINDMQSEFWGVFWVDVSDFASAERDFKNIADQIRPGTAHQNLGHALSALAEVDFNNHPWLLVLDNADERREDYARFFPSTPGGSILLTSRNHECAIHETIGCCELESVSFDESVLLLLKAAKVRQRDWESYRPQAETITGLLGCHTLTLVQAGAFISRDVRNCNKYPKLFKENRQRLLATSWNQAQSKYGNVYATFEVSARTLECEERTEAKDALCLLGVFGMFHHSGFPTWVFEDASKGLTYAETGGHSNDVLFVSTRLANLLPSFLSERRFPTLRLQEGLYCLEALSFIKQANVDDQDGVTLVSLHPLVHAWAKDRLDQRSQEHTWVMTGSVIALSAKSEPHSSRYSDFTNWELHVRQLQPHIDSFLNNRVRCTPRDPRMVEHLQVDLVVARILSSYELYQKAKSLLFEVFKDSEAEPFKLKNIYLLPLYAEMATVLRSLEEYGSSLDLWHQIISLKEANSADIALLYRHELAWTYGLSGSIHIAMAMYEAVVSVDERIYSADHPDLIFAQQGLAAGYLETGQFEKGVALFEHVVKIQQKTYPETSKSRLSSERTLAKAYSFTGQFEKAARLYEHVSQIQQKILPETSPRRLCLEHDFATAYLRNGQSNKAMEMLEKVVQIQQTTLAGSSELCLDSAFMFGTSFILENRDHEALQLLERVARIERTTISPAYPKRIRRLAALSALYIKLEQPEKANDVGLEVQDAFRNLSTGDSRWREYGEWLADWKQYFGIENGSHASSEYYPDTGSDSPPDSTNAQYGSGNESDAGQGPHDAEYESEVDEKPPRWKRFAKRILKRDKRKE